MDRDLYESIKEAAKGLELYYDIDKIKSYSVYVWTKDEDEYDLGENVFDIMKNEIVFYNKEHKIPEEVMPIIRRIQQELIEV